MINDAIATAECFRHVLRNSREISNAWVMSNNRYNLAKCDTWVFIFYQITSYMGCYVDCCIGFISSCRLSWFWCVCLQVGEVGEAEEMMLFTNGTSVVVLKANGVSVVCTRHSRDALWWFKSNLDIRLPMFLKLLKLWCRTLNGWKAARREGRLRVDGKPAGSIPGGNP